MRRRTALAALASAVARRVALIAPEAQASVVVTTRAQVADAIAAGASVLVFPAGVWSME